jgi:hypothetical protein
MRDARANFEGVGAASRRKRGTVPPAMMVAGATVAGGVATVIAEAFAKGVKIDPDALYTDEFVSELFGYTKSTLSTFRTRRKHFAFVRVGNRALYPGRALLDALKHHKSIS